MIIGKKGKIIGTITSVNRKNYENNRIFYEFSSYSRIDFRVFKDRFSSIQGQIKNTKFLKKVASCAF